MPQKYTKKHQWKQCEYVENNHISPGIHPHRCNAVTRVCRNGKYLCWRHSPKRIETINKFFRRNAINAVRRLEEKLIEYKRRLKVDSQILEARLDVC